MTFYLRSLWLVIAPEKSYNQSKNNYLREEFVMKKIEKNEGVDREKQVQAKAVDEFENTMDMRGHQKEDALPNPAEKMPEGASDLDKKPNPMLERHIDAVIEQMKEEQYFKEQSELMERFEQSGNPQRKAYWEEEHRQNQRRFEYDYEEDFYEPIYEDDYE